ncbi:MAG: NAD(P)-binding protein [Candidatus Promineifilaceae bacterium]|nr:NAD(P)-binding protein [Candidatus Promineifilaceae bacterium]
MAEKKKVAVLGGGLGSIVSAYELTATEELREQYEVTVYQLGWRIGGKGASGRNPDYAQRIEEHGLHVWLGFYENAFKAMRDCYEELGRKPGAPLATIDEALKPTYSVTLFEEYESRWTPWGFTMPENDEEPGTDQVLPNFWDMASMGIQWSWEFFELLLGIKVEKPGCLNRLLPFLAKDIEEFDWDGRDQPDWWDDLIEELDHEFKSPKQAGEMQSLELAHALAHGRKNQPQKYTAEEHYSYFVELVDRFREWLWKKVVNPHLDDDRRRVYFEMFDTMASVFIGIVRDDLLNQGFDVVNDLEFREWLTEQGAMPITLSNSPLIRGWYDLAFCYDNGDINKPDMAAGSTARALLRMVFTYKGGFFYKMQAGMGDTIFTPFYQVLRRRGVQFKFFHAVTHLGLSADKKLIDAIEVVPQVELTVSEYQPLVNVKDLECWPSVPHWKQLKKGHELQEQGVNFEQEINPLNAKPVTLQRGEHFDLVICGISVAALPAICSELIDDKDNPKFKAMIDNSRTVMTQAFQLWVSQDAVSQLGLPFNPAGVAGSYVEPVDTFADMSHLLPREAWKAPFMPHNISYVCGVLEDKKGETQAEADERVKRRAIEYMRKNIAGIWPQSVISKTDPAFNWDLLIDEHGGHGAERFNSQYWRANKVPTERYVLTPAKRVKFRLRTDESGYDNLFLTGDWIKNGLDAGCVESAVMSGMQTSRAICGSPKIVVGEHDDWLKP